MKTTISEKAATVQPLPARMENEPQHTPGKWEVWNFGESAIDIAVGPDVGGVAVCQVTSTDAHGIATPETMSRAKANARLIAAAPELLRCLFHLEKELQMSFDDVPAGVDAWMAEARAAIAAAKGAADADRATANEYAALTAVAEAAEKLCDDQKTGVMRNALAALAAAKGGQP